MIDNTVKLVIWDLDETFWHGTLGEEGATPIPRNVEIVRELAKRGIINSICSKNNFEQTKAKLSEMGIYEFFVFPSITYNPKGRSVAEILENAALRAENVLFIDDNALNIAEVSYFNPGIMACHPADVLDGLLEHPNLAGKADPALTRLTQYQLLQRKVEERDASTLSNDEFLRASNIRITMDYDVDSNLDRVIELINRTNQLNYTKRRLNTAEDIADFRRQLNSFGCFAGCVSAIDAYGDYGLIGFFLVHMNAGNKKLIHFVFSCRTMNMGIEQYIYEMLGRPAINIIQPVSYDICMHAAVDWINVDNAVSGAEGVASGGQLVLLGGCDLLQVASYCSSKRLEFVNKMQGTDKIRYDDPGFIISDRAAVRSCEAIREIPHWTYQDTVQFDQGISSAELILVSLWAAMRGTYVKTPAGVLIHLKKVTLKKVKLNNPAWLGTVQELSLEPLERFKLITASFDSIARQSRPDSTILVIGCDTRGNFDKKNLPLKTQYNDVCREYCEENPDRFQFIDVDAIVPEENLADKGHFTRAGYLTLARHILALAARPANRDLPDATRVLHHILALAARSADQPQRALKVA